MTKRPRETPEQLCLELDITAVKRDAAVASGRGEVLHFVDATTRRIRQKAIERVRRTGIFNAGPTSKDSN